MDDQAAIEAKMQEMSSEEKGQIVKREFKRLWFTNFFVELMIVVFNGGLIYYIPKYYPYFLNQFLLTIAFALFNIVVTLKMKKSLQRFQIFISCLHFGWIFYGFATAPVFLTAVTSTYEDCDPKRHACNGLFNSDLFHTKMTVGLLAQGCFAIFLYGEMRRICVLATFPFQYFDNQMPEPEQKKIEEPIPEKNPNDIKIVA
ncbi:X-BoX promoter element regulated [Caenorhabditis elegans]|uniref:X-BoX promoter element regulated n=1 Tax=Caenorhabditis elegans TaxID=6239 RepID=Q21511_CAEEL|nr:X-BoX promoter element regulated [Caenorhabditis elegans]CAA83614.1 X-BoX promoter element regulated [Caenorhabditis elegans]|eukprot:NP_499227.1 X-BoX promoter element regulated [Caenorhabditis elegans]